MTSAVNALLETFDALSEAERREAAVEILRRMTPADGELPEGVLVEAADALFCMLDSEEDAFSAPIMKSSTRIAFQLEGDGHGLSRPLLSGRLPP